jgi:hypothetical protein
MSLSPQSDENRSPTKSPHFSVISQTPIKGSPLSHLRSVTPANVGRRRVQMASLLSSPARRSHHHQMSSIFQKAAISLSAPRLVNNPGHIAGKDEITSGNDFNDVNSPESLNTISYPGLPSSPALSSHIVSKSKVLIPARVPLSPFHSTRNRGDDQIPHSIETIKQQPFLQKLGRPGAPKFEQKDNYVSIEYPESSSSSTSSASWTGDSQFFIPKTREVPIHERQCSVLKWLDLLPTTPEEHSEVEGEEVGTLSPSVEVERGSMRRRRREWEKRDRCASFDDDDIFSIPLR